MVFSSPTFLFLFLPVTLLVYLATPARWRNSCLLLASVIFYVWGAGAQVFVLLYVSLVSYAGVRILRGRADAAAGLGTLTTAERPQLMSARAQLAELERAVNQAASAGSGGVAVLAPAEPAEPEPEPAEAPAEPFQNQVARAPVAVLIVLLLIPIVVYKYVPPVSSLLSSIGGRGGPTVHWVLPLGISFFTFHGISYVVDACRGDLPPERSLRDYLLYLFLFPHQIAGPIVRFRQLATELKDRRDVTLENVGYGMTRFAWGLFKKACIADTAGVVADAAFGIAGPDMTTSTAWIGALAYTVQIYFDFSGYCDMAIGLAAVFGFRFPENFNAPYTSTGPADFWRRWHMTLSSWFRDYVYIPLGGNRHGAGREYGALLMTFFLTSLWHGAAWTFLVWGGVHSLALLLERLTGLRNRLTERSGWVGFRRVLMAVFIVASWVPFRAPTLHDAVQIWHAMAGGAWGPPAPEVLLTLTPWTTLAAALGLLVFFGPRTRTGFELVHGQSEVFRYPVAIVTGPVLLVVSVVSVLWLDFSPFLYFQF